MMVKTAESPEVRQARLAAILAELDAVSGGSVFLDLCELVLLLSERTEMMLKWTHPRGVVVHIQHRPRVAAPKARRAGSSAGRRPAGAAGQQGSGAP